MSKDIFCKIIDGEIPKDKVSEGDSWIAIDDIHPQAPKHVLIIPKKHIGGISEINEGNAEEFGKLLLAVKEVAMHIGIPNDYRIVINQGKDVGQTVPHLHIHVIGGHKLVESFLDK